MSEDKNEIITVANGRVPSLSHPLLSDAKKPRLEGAVPPKPPVPLKPTTSEPQPEGGSQGSPPKEKKE